MKFMKIMTWIIGAFIVLCACNKAECIDYKWRFYFDKFGNSDMCDPTGSFKAFLSMPEYKKLIDNTTSATLLNDSELASEEFRDELYFNSCTSLGILDVADVTGGKAFLRVNKEKKVIYTVKKSNSWYIFRAYWPGNKDDIRPCLLSQWCVKKVPNISFFENINIGVTSIEDVMKNDLSFRFLAKENGGVSEHAFTDKNGSIAYVQYVKGDDDKLYVQDVSWMSNGRNVLPYLLPIDRQLIDPNYVPPVSEPGCTIL